MQVFYHEGCSLSDKGEIRENNEDSALNIVLSEYLSGNKRLVSLLAVADGVGGGSSGEIASRTVIRSIEARLLSQVISDDHSNYSQLIKRSFDEANSEVLKLARSDSNYLGMATTLTLALVLGDKCFVGHIGDSRCYLVRGNHLEMLTLDHAIGRILQQSLGGNNELDVFLKEVRILNGDILLLCSDGLSKQLNNNAIARILKESEDLNSACRTLIKEANLSGGNDNVSVSVLRLREMNIDEKGNPL